jgi:steroid delta-isomerase-like uncharacterized protein
MAQKKSTRRREGAKGDDMRQERPAKSAGGAGVKDSRTTREERVHGRRSTSPVSNRSSTGSPPSGSVGSSRAQGMARALGNADVARAIYDAFNERDFDRGTELCAPELELIDIASGTTLHGHAGQRQFMQNWATAFPDARCRITKLIDAGDSIVVEFTGTGTNAGPFETPQGVMPATNRRAELRCCDVLEFDGGKVARMRTYYDAATLMRQLKG